MMEVTTANGVPQMPRYKSHKTVHALKIASVIDKGTDATTDENPIVEIHFEDDRFKPWLVNLCGKPTPAAGWYLVQYEDGYVSFSPAEQFEKGNTLEAKLSEDAPKKPSGMDLRSFPQSDIDNWFTYHAPTPVQVIQYGEIRTAAKILAETINRHVPGSADKTAAMRKLRETVMAANLAIACNTTSGGNFPQAGTGPAISGV